jgi:hypothetical protein
MRIARSSRARPSLASRTGMGINHLEIPPEDEHKLSRSAWPSSTLYGTLSTLSPDVLVVDLLWLQPCNCIRELDCKKVFLWEVLDPKFFSIALPTGKIGFDPSMFDAVVAIEPFEGDRPSISVNPMILRNRDEILQKEETASRLGLDSARKACLTAINAHPGDFERVSEKYAHLASEGYRLVRTTNYKGLLKKLFTSYLHYYFCIQPIIAPAFSVFLPRRPARVFRSYPKISRRSPRSRCPWTDKVVRMTWMSSALDVAAAIEGLCGPLDQGEVKLAAGGRMLFVIDRGEGGKALPEEALEDVRLTGSVAQPSSWFRRRGENRRHIHSDAENDAAIAFRRSREPVHATD